MILNDEQNDRFFDTMDSLLYYVNERFRVVEGFSLDFANALDDVKGSLVAHELWDNVGIIDEFVRDNPHRLPQKCLDTALGWKNALPGVYTLVRYQSGRAVLMGEAGVFSVSGVTYELDEEIGPAPAYVELVLLPFDDVIVYDGFLQAYDTDGTPAELQRIQDEFEDRCAKEGIALTAADFAERAGAFLAAQRDKELDALLAGVAAAAEASQAEEVLPAGFHRGSLAGLTAAERAERTLVQMRARHIEVVGEPVDDATMRRWNQALDCLDACVIMCGAARVDDAYAQYCSLVSDVLPRDEFDALIGAFALSPEVDFGTWSHAGIDYVVHYTLTPDFVASEHAREAREAFGGLLKNRETGEFALEGGLGAGIGAGSGAWGARRGAADLPTELQWLEDYKRELVASQGNLPMKPLSRTLLENDVVGELLDDPSVVRLRAFLDERIPDGQDDLTFADDVVYEMVMASIESGSLEALFGYARDLGLEGCCADEDRLPTLVANAFNAMPSWENNGWSPQELYEQLTGRRLFYNEDGSVMKVGPDEPCPCGSGRKYRDCCGR